MCVCIYTLNILSKKNVKNIFYSPQTITIHLRTRGYSNQLIHNYRS